VKVKEVIMKVRYSLLAFCAVIVLSACATVEDAGQIASGRQALFAGNYQAALSYFQSAAQTNPNAVYGATLRMGVFSFLGQAQYLNGQYAQAAPDTTKSALHAPQR
jgi:outer membrane protein assembly factor BamD (BamD/ComL family)